MRTVWSAFTVVPFVAMLAGCQSYDWVYIPNADRQGVHLVFKVEQPSKADILFVIDNSSSMLTKQQALIDSVNVLLESLAPQDTRYRIGITSTDAIGYTEDCLGAALTAPGAKGNCLNPAAQLRRPHDGALGRLLAAYDPEIFKTDAPWVTALLDALREDDRVLDTDILTKLGTLMPTGPTTHPPQLADPTIFPGFVGESGARWVIDRETIRLEACQVCGSLEREPGPEPEAERRLVEPIACDSDHPQYASCADPIAQVMVQAYFRANVSALGNRGMGWEEGLRASELAIGIDPRDLETDSQGNPTALHPAFDLTAVGDPLDANDDGANTFGALDTATGEKRQASWVRDEALLAVMYVTDEEDCSMPADLWANQCAYEVGCGGSWVEPPNWQPNPQGSLCYQEEAQARMLSTARMAQLMVLKKGSASRVAVGVIGGLTQTGVAPLVDRQATPTDCAFSAAGPTAACSCLVGVDFADPNCNTWCYYTTDKNGSCTADNTFCEGMAAKRYVAFANSFGRRTFETVCLDTAGRGFGDAMAKFAQIATLACFELKDVRPAGNPVDPSLITVKRRSKAEADACVALGAAEPECRASASCVFVDGGCQPRPPTTLAVQPAGSNDPGWYYDPAENKVCLTGLDRLIGDEYDIFVQHRDKLDFTN